MGAIVPVPVFPIGFSQDHGRDVLLMGQGTPPVMYDINATNIWDVSENPQILMHAPDHAM